MFKAKAEATERMRAVAEQMQALARIANAKFIDEFLGVSEPKEETKVVVEEKPVVEELTNEIITTLQFTNVRITGRFYIDQARFERHPENIVGSWELGEVTIEDIESGMRCNVEIRTDHDVFERCAKKLTDQIRSADPNSPLWEKNLTKRRIYHEKEFLNILVPYLTIFIAREKRILLVKLKR
jgi:hypothetical protein